MLPHYRFSPQDKFSPFIRELIKSNYISLDEAVQLMKEVRYRKLPLLKVLEIMTQKTLPPQLMRKYKKYHLWELKILFGVDFFDLEKEKINIQEIAELINSIIAIIVCRRYKIFPIKKIDKPSVIDNNENNSILLIAMVNPENLDALDHVKKLLRIHDLGLQRCVISEEDHEILLNKYYEYNQSFEHQKDAKLNNHDQVKYHPNLLRETQNVVVDHDDDDDQHLNIDIDGKDTPVIKLVNKILIKAIEEKASEIHIEPQKTLITIRFRINGILRPFFENLPKQIISAIANRLKVMCELDISVKNVPQEGKFKRLFKNKNITFFTKIIAGQLGENIYIEIYDSQQIKLSLESLIDDKNILAQINNLRLLSQGLIIFSGSSNITKTSLIYSFLTKKRQKNINIFSLEKFCKFDIDDVNQVTIENQKNKSYAEILKNILLQNPDIIYISKLTDKETAEIIFDSALQGKLIMVEMDETSINNVLLRFLEWGIQTHRIAVSLKGIIHQTSIRKLCKQCRIYESINPEKIERFKWFNFTNKKPTVYRANSVDENAQVNDSYLTEICDKCDGIGYDKQIFLYEIMIINSYLQKLMLKNINIIELREEAIKQGMDSIIDKSINLVEKGETSLEEIERIFPDLITERIADLYKLNKQSSKNQSVNDKILEIEKELNKLQSKFSELKQIILTQK